MPALLTAHPAGIGNFAMQWILLMATGNYNAPEDALVDIDWDEVGNSNTNDMMDGAPMNTALLQNVITMLNQAKSQGCGYTVEEAWNALKNGATIQGLMEMAEQLDLNVAQINWLWDNSETFQAIQTFIDQQNQPLSNYNTEFVMLHLQLMMDIPLYYQENSQANFPVIRNEAWANTVHAPDEDLTAAERVLIQAHPVAALQIRWNVDIAITKTIEHMGQSGVNDKSDAFRHAYFQAINTMDIGETLTQQFSDAHESEVLQQFNLEKEMDLFNNAVGISYGLNFPTSDDQMAVYIKEWALQTGGLRYLSPINYSDPCFYGCPDNTNGTHGISASTQLIPTN